MAMNDHDMLSDAQLESLFEDAREEAILPSQALWERVSADADACLPVPQPETRRGATRPGLLAGLVAAIGGWPSLAGLATATIAGVWIGFSNPEMLTDTSVSDLLPGLSGTEVYQLEDFTPGFAGFADEFEEG